MHKRLSNFCATAVHICKLGSCHSEWQLPTHICNQKPKQLDEFANKFKFIPCKKVELEDSGLDAVSNYVKAAT